MVCLSSFMSLEHKIWLEWLNWWQRARVLVMRNLLRSPAKRLGSKITIYFSRTHRHRSPPAPDHLYVPRLFYRTSCGGQMIRGDDCEHQIRCGNQRNYYLTEINLRLLSDKIDKKEYKTLKETTRTFIDHARCALAT